MAAQQCCERTRASRSPGRSRRVILEEVHAPKNANCHDIKVAMADQGGFQVEVLCFPPPDLATLLDTGFRIPGAPLFARRDHFTDVVGVVLSDTGESE